MTSAPEPQPSTASASVDLTPIISRIEQLEAAAGLSGLAPLLERFEHLEVRVSTLETSQPQSSSGG